jgi:hypothetical protein
MSNLIMLALVGDMKLACVLFAFMLALDDAFKANVDEDRDVVRLVVAVLEAKVDVALVAVVLVVLADEAANEPLFAPVFAN